MKSERQVQTFQKPQHNGQLDRHHQRRAHNRSPRQNDGERKLRVSRAKCPKRGDHGRVPNHRRRVGKEKSPVAVQDSEAPCGKNEKPRAGKQDADNPNGQFAFFATESRRNRVDQIRGRQNADQDEDGGTEREQGRNGSGGASGFLILIPREQRGVNRNERSGENPFAKQILQRVGNPEGRLERVGGGGISEIMGKHAIANQSRNTAQENSGGDQKRRALRGEAAGD